MPVNDGCKYTLLELSAKVEYALLALIELASQSEVNHPLTINEITARHPIPERYLEQIFTLLRRGGLIQSQRGAKGGYMLVKEPWQVSVLDVITLIEGNRKERGLATNQASVEQELVHEIWQQANTTVKAALSEYSLHDLCQHRDSRKQISHMYYI
ncbi:MAG: Rrf2 family transcriptional regulator [Oscillatoriales cyanobacterium C42_A2020_001]|nr:Rrf2 family transcriptional regulator [Leptolyngbyaceae cyanobacterium C42_A2020_001]